MKRTVFFNGIISPEQEIGLPFNDLGLLRGYGLCEVLRTYNRLPMDFEAHLNRFEAGAKVLSLKLAYSQRQLGDIIQNLIEQNTTGEASIKLILTGGPSEDGISFNPETPTFFIEVKDFHPLPEDYYTKGVKLVSEDYQRHLPEIKSLNYLVAVRSKYLNQESDIFEVLYHHNGKLREAGTSNIFLVAGQKLITPGQGVLKGITRQTVMNLARQKYEVEEREIGLAELFEAEEVFLTATNKDVLPVVTIDGHFIGDGQVGSHSQFLLKQLRQHYAG